MRIIESPFGIEDRTYIMDYSAKGMQTLELRGGSIESPGIVEAIGDYVEEQRTNARNLPDEALAEFILSMGCLWGNQICHAYNWEWVHLSFHDQGGWALVSPDRALAIYPLDFIKRFVDHADRENTLVLLFNMLAEPNLANARPGEYLILG